MAQGEQIVRDYHAPLSFLFFPDSFPLPWNRLEMRTGSRKLAIPETTPFDPAVGLQDCKLRDSRAAFEELRSKSRG
jgi:hypothetical protein